MREGKALKLEDLKRLAAQRTKGEWHLAVPCNGAIEGWSNIEASSENIAIDVEDKNAEFIAVCANNIDKLLAVVEAADRLCQELHMTQYYKFGDLIDALTKLEGK